MLMRFISAKIQRSILHCTLHNLSYILCLSFNFALTIVWRFISAKIQRSILHCTLHNLSNILCLSFNFELAIQLFCIQHSTLIYATFDIQLFISSSQVFEFDLQVQWDVHSLFRIQHLASVL